MKTLLRNCPVCGHGEGDVLHTQRFALFDDSPLPPEYDVASCVACGMIFADTSATAADYERLYADSSIYQDPFVSCGSAASEWDIARIDDLARRILPLVRSKDARILDVGCGNGGFLEQLRAAGLTNVVGVDPSPACVANARARGIEAWRGSLAQLPVHACDCDLAILNNVLEHVLDLRGAIAAIDRVCRPGAALFVSVPDAHAYAEHVHAPFQDFNT